MTEMQDICNYLETRGFESLSLKGYHIQVYRKGGLLIRIEDQQEKKNNDE